MKKEHALELLNSYLPSLRDITVTKEGIEMRTVGAIDAANEKEPDNFNVFVYLHRFDDPKNIIRITIGEYAVLAAAAILKTD